MKWYSTCSPILVDEDIASQIQLYLSEHAKKGFIKAQDVVEIFAGPEIQEQLHKLGIERTKISEHTGREWLRKFGWWYGKKKNGMYLDGHEREDVVAYRNAFVDQFMKLYAPRMYTWDREGREIKPSREGFTGDLNDCPFRLILVTHNESTFHANDKRKSQWTHKSDAPMPVRKDEGASLMASDFLTSEWGHLKSEDGTEYVHIPFILKQSVDNQSEREARILFKAGKNRDGYFDCDDLLKQVDKAIDIFEGRTNGFAQGLFIFDNAPGHQKRLVDGLSARKMPKFPHETWTHHKDGPKMRPTTLPDGQIQDFYFPDDHPDYPGYFKGMQVIIEERGLWPQDGQTLLAQCEGFKCEPGHTDCCCRRLLFTQPDFVNQKNRLQEFVASRGHICDFYPKYHCELNFIEQYWGAAKLYYQNVPLTSTIAEMEHKVIKSLNSVPLEQIRRYAVCATRLYLFSPHN